MQTPFDTYILDLFYAKLHAQTQEQPAHNNNKLEMETICQKGLLKRFKR